MRLLAIASFYCLTVGLGGCERPQRETHKNRAPATESKPNDSAARLTQLPAAKAMDTGAHPCGSSVHEIFSCKVSNNRFVSVCRIDRPGQAAFAQYRFGKPGAAPELVWPSDGNADRLTLAHAMYSGGGETQLSFIRSDTSYVVYSRMVRTNFVAGEPNDPEFSAGVAVLKGPDLVTELLCTDETSIDIAKAEPLTRRDDSVFRYHVGRDWKP